MPRVFPFLLVALIVWLLWPQPVKVLPVQPLPEGWSHYCRQDQIRGLALVGEKIFIGGLSGLKEVSWRKPGEPVAVAAAPGFDLVRIEAMVVDASATLWVGHEAGLCSLDLKGRWRDFTADLPDAKVLALCFDAARNLWVGTWRGAARYEPGTGKWQRYDVADGLPAERVRTIFADSQGGIWFGTSTAPGGGLVRWFAGEKYFYTTADLLAHPHVTAMMEDRAGRLWIGSGFFDKGGVTVFPGWKSNDLTGKTILHQGTGLAGNKGRSLLQDSSGVIWVGSELDGLTRIETDGSMKVFTMADGLVGDEVMCMLEDPDGNLWLGQELGLTRISAAAQQTLH